MGLPQEPAPAALIAGITFDSPGTLGAALEILRGEFGPVEFSSPEFAFDMTDYYRAEMGENLGKQFFCFRDPILPDALPGIKLLTNEIEMRLVREENGIIRRRANIDPGYVTLAKLALASTKDYSHRIYIGRGIYAEITLRFIQGTFTSLETTYPDYQTPVAIGFFNAARDYVKRKRSSWTRENESSS
ncbi:MAG: DUF4416 family protein [Candidatus Latescibacterota bacterium]